MKFIFLNQGSGLTVANKLQTGKNSILASGLRFTSNFG